MGRKSSGLTAFLALVTMICLPLQSSGEQVQVISVHELKTILDSGEKIMLLNPLPDILFNEANIPGSVNIPLREIPYADAFLPGHKEEPIVTYCLGPKSLVSKRAAHLLAAKGFRNVKWFRDGTVGWILAGHPVEYKNALPKIAVPAIDPVQLRGKLQEMLVLDIRSPSLYESGWIKGSRKMPIDDLSRRYTELSKGSKIVVVDHSGNEVIVAARFLQQKGYDVHGLQGGIVSWASYGYPLENQTSQRISSRIE